MSKTKNKPNYKDWVLSFFKHTWSWPLILFMLVGLLTGLKIHGSSLGMFHQFLYGPQVQDQNLLFGQPRGIRSDEWLSNTPMTVSQYYNDWPVFNSHVGPSEAGGHDMTVVKDFPTKGWESIFKPQNWGFFALPLENGFAYRWLMLSFLLLVSAYFFILEILPKRRDLAILLPLILYLSPFFHWWYLYTSFGSVFYTLFALTLAMRLHKTNNWKSKLLYAGGITYAGVGMALILYPPFQISAAVAGGAFYLGWLLNNFDLRSQADRIKLVKDLAYLALAGAITLGLLVIYYLQHTEVIKAIMNSAHPGERRIKSGDRNWFYFIHEWSSQLQYRLQFPRAGTMYYANQSESSNFILFAPFLMLPSVYIVIKDRLRRLKPDWLLIGLNLLLILLLIRQHVPIGDVLFRLMALDRVPNYRLLLGIGVAQWLLLCAYLRRPISDYFNSKREQIFLWIVALLAGLLALWTGFYSRRLYPGFIQQSWEIVLAAALMSAIVYLVIRGKRAGLILLLAFSAFSTGIINPIYRGMGTVLDTPLSAEIQRVSTPDDTWAVLEDIRFENIVLSSGRASLSGLYSYPRFDLWEPIDPLRQQTDIYNRSAHVVFFVRNHIEDSKLLKQAVNKFGVILNPCSAYAKKVSLDYLLSPEPIEGKCITEISRVNYPLKTFYIYRIN